PRGLLEAVDLLEEDLELCEMLGNPFTTTYAAIKRAEFETFMEVISPWEREYLLLNVCGTASGRHLSRPCCPAQPAVAAVVIYSAIRLWPIEELYGLTSQRRPAATET